MPDIAILLDDDGEGLRQHQRNKDEWGARGWARLNDVCLWFEQQDVDELPCSADEGVDQVR